MKLYPKQLNSLEALERERLRLKREIAASNPVNVFDTGAPANNTKPGNTSPEEETPGGDLLVTFADLLTSKGTVSIALSLLGPLLNVLGRKAGKGILKPLAKEVLGGYVKWKLIEISYKTALRFIRSKQHKHKSKKD